MSSYYVLAPPPPAIWPPQEPSPTPLIPEEEEGETEREEEESACSSSSAEALNPREGIPSAQLCQGARMTDVLAETVVPGPEGDTVIITTGPLESVEDIPQVVIAKEEAATAQGERIGHLINLVRRNWPPLGGLPTVFLEASRIFKGEGHLKNTSML